ncbi:MAG: hypothetical protein ABI600_09060 [Luteolibacter sp.]
MIFIGAPALTMEEFEDYKQDFIFGGSLRIGLTLDKSMEVMRFIPVTTDSSSPATTNRDLESVLEADLCVHIFTVSAGMVGVCLTVIGILRVVITARKIDTAADDLLAADAVLFLVSCLLSYWALRTRSLRRMHRVERVADTIFISALLFMVVICGFITYALTAV